MSFCGGAAEAVRVELVRVELAPLRGTAIAFPQGFRPERPSRQGKMWFVLEVDVIERFDPATPMIGRASEPAQTRTKQRVMSPGDLTLIRRLSVPRGIDTAPLEQNNLPPAPRQFQRERDTSRTCPSDADFGFKDIRQLGSRIPNH